MSDCLSCAIGDSLSAFARGLDRGDAEAVVALFTPDAVYDNGRSRLAGQAELERWIRERGAAGERTTRHMWSSLQLTPSTDDPDVVAATSTWVCYAANAPAPVDAVKVWSVADFEDVFRRDGDRWLVAERRIRTLFRDPSVAPPK
ncbi:MAG TPA: nuclear transport factor 2 family protein [Ilumatobacter sp.]|nr:nuclear transport factor 2 family protein [Ilumatobacter sp.]